MKYPNCTWADPEPGGRCQRPARHTKQDKDGRVWANLCKAHNTEYEQANDISREDWKPGPMLRAWVRAGGGAEVMAKRMVNG